jgi:transcriptional regulator with XRE-family HTH domain
LAQFSNNEARRRELAEFLRSKRKRLSPANAGLPSGRRRMTPGLRREEVAELAGIGTTWYTWLEQARDIRPSERTLRSVARALQLDRAEKRYLLALALERAPTRDRDELISPLLSSIIDGISWPVFVLSRPWDLVLYNIAANALFDFDYAPHRNFLRTVFVPQFRALFPNWRWTARQLLGQFRSQNAGALGHPPIVELVADLTQRSHDFRQWWAEQAISETHGLHMTLDHPIVGRLHFECEHLCLKDSPTLSIILYLCDGVETRRRLDELLRQQECGEHTRTHNIWTAADTQRFAEAP